MSTTRIVGRGRRTQVVAVVAVQVVAFAVAHAVGRPTLYAVFALASAGVLAYAAGRGVFETLLAIFGTGLLLAFGLPLLMMVARQKPGVVLEKALDPNVQHAIYLSIYGPLLTAIVATTLGLPLAYLLARGFPGSALVASLVDLPLVVPHSVAGLAVLFAFGRGAAFPQFKVWGTMVGMVLAMTFVSAPFAVNAIREGFEATDDRLEQAARSLGASRWETFRRVEWPLAARSVLTGSLLSWARAVSEFGAVVIVAYNVEIFYPPTGETVTTQHAPVFIHNTFLSQGLTESGAVAVLLLALVTVIFLVIRGVAYGDDRNASGVVR